MKKKIKFNKDKFIKFIKSKSNKFEKLINDRFKKLNENQKKMIFHWLGIVLAAEVIFFVFQAQIHAVLFLISILFFVGFILRLFEMYPGKTEPLILDALAVVITLLITFLYRYSVISPGIAMLFAPLIILPHIIYIIRTKL